MTQSVHSNRAVRDAALDAKALEIFLEMPFLQVFWRPWETCSQPTPVAAVDKAPTLEKEGDLVNQPAPSDPPAEVLFKTVERALLLPPTPEIVIHPSVPVVTIRELLWKGLEGDVLYNGAIVNVRHRMCGVHIKVALERRKFCASLDEILSGELRGPEVSAECAAFFLKMSREAQADLKALPPLKAILDGENLCVGKTATRRGEVSVVTVDGKGKERKITLRYSSGNKSSFRRGDAIKVRRLMTRSVEGLDRQQQEFLNHLVGNVLRASA